MKNLRFEFRVLDEGGEVIASDWTTIGDATHIDNYGGCETVDIHVGATLRAVKREALRHEAELLQQAVEDVACCGKPRIVEEAA